MLQFIQEQGFCGANRGSGMCCFVLSAGCLLVVHQMFYCYSKTEDGTGCILHNSRGERWSRRLLCCVQLSTSVPPVRCLASAGSLINHYISIGIVYDSTSMGNKLANLTKTCFVLFFCSLLFLQISTVTTC